MFTDQALYDLDVLPSPGSSVSLYEHLNHTITEGGKARLRKALNISEASPDSVLRRSESVGWLRERHDSWQPVLTENEIFYISQYLASRYVIVKKRRGKIRSWIAGIFVLAFDRARYHFILSGSRQTLLILQKLKDWIGHAYQQGIPTTLGILLREMDELITSLRIPEATYNIFLHEEPSPALIADVDKVLREGSKDTILLLFEKCYECEVWYSLARAGKEMDLIQPQFGKSGAGLALTDLRHPLIAGCKANTLTGDTTAHLYLLTGPNMAGKSTFLKSIGLAYYTAYLGIGVAASSALLPWIDAVVTSICSEDDLGRGYSYFFSEVQRVKHMATIVSGGKRALIIADELFKGTNVKDAMACTETVLRGFLKHPHSIFFVSTHLTEIAATLAREGACRPLYFEGKIDGAELSFDHMLHEGVSEMRLGAYIMEREGIVEMLEKVTI